MSTIMLKLFIGEWKKLSGQITTYLMIGVILLAIGAAAVYLHFTSGPGEPLGDDWKTVMQQNTEKLKEDAGSLPPNSLALEANQEQIARNEYRIKHDLKPDYTINGWVFTESVKPLISLVGLFVIGMAASSVSSEFSQGTIKYIMTRPISKASFLIAKYFTVLSFGLFLLAVLFFCSLGLGLIIFGNPETSPVLLIRDGQVVEESQILYLIRYFLLSSVDILLVASLAFMISTVFRNNALALGFSLLLYFMGGTVTRLIAVKFDWAKFSLFANTDLNSYFSGAPLIKGMTLTFSLSILAAYLACFLFVSFFTFYKRDIAV
jgi:ABC-2 type transport system permease protein